MRQVHENAGFLAAPYEIETPARETSAVVSAEAEGGIGCVVGGEMDETDVPHAAPGEARNLVQIALEGVRALDAEERPNCPFPIAHGDFGRGAHKAKARVTPGDGFLQEVNLGVRGMEWPACSP
jgi:hypothetical protein